VRRTFDDVQRMVNEMWDAEGAPPMLSVLGSGQTLMHHSTGVVISFELTRGDLSMPEAEFKERCLRPRLGTLKASIKG
jgi:hypothetical protein